MRKDRFHENITDKFQELIYSIVFKLKMNYENEQIYSGYLILGEIRERMDSRLFDFT